MTFKNTSGYEPLDLRVLVMPDAIEKKTPGGIIMPETARERDEFAQCEGVLVAVGECSWQGSGPDFTRPIPGDRVLFAKYGGIMIDGTDGNKYRIMNDEDVTARIIGGDDA
jgi:chaperonin GroES